ncbi:serine/threonine-protein kinase [Actinacidiphila oryziradicis]|uniref:serine/threonine-protein kinase n=1 Tax=Actinacidiphila oryziradicis TaxID=2571141 RepID=UPI001FE9F0B0|nr:serine/threonine-protein kinase [Actinacidiphila oryziradicis]
MADRYRLGDLLGSGGMGEVWGAVDEVLGRSVAVKLLRNQGADSAAITRFQLEAQTAARLNHPHVVAVYDFGTDQCRLYLVMELLDGRSLADELTEHAPLSLHRAAQFGAQAAAGLAAAHQQGVVHRDIKPGNLLLTCDGRAKVGDFGIARFADESATLTTTGQIIGTSSYLAPEQALGRPAGPPADMYALGCVLYELVTGHPPFRADTPMAVVFQHVEASPEAPRRLRPDLPESFEAFILRLLAKDPAERPTAQQTADALAASGLAADRLATAAAGATHRLPSIPAIGKETGQQPGTSRWRSRRARLVAGIVVTGAVAAAVALSTTSPDVQAGRAATTRPSPAQQDTLPPSTAPTTPSTAPTTAAAPTTPSTAPTTAAAHTTPSTAPTTAAAHTTPSTAPTTAAAHTTPSTAPTTPSTAPTTPSTAPSTPSTAPTSLSAAPTTAATAPTTAAK